MRRRDVLSGAGLALAGAVAGCAGLAGDEPITFAADRGTVPESVADDEGYELADTSTQTIEREFEVGGQTRTVEVRNRVTEYDKAVDLGPVGEIRAATFTVLTTPQVSVLGQTFNPVSDMSAEDLADQIQSQYEDISGLEPVGEGSVTILGTETTQTKFEGQVRTVAGQELDIFLHLTDPVENGDDFVIGVGGYPRRLPDEEDSILALLRAVEHETD